MWPQECVEWPVAEEHTDFTACGKGHMKSISAAARAVAGREGVAHGRSCVDTAVWSGNAWCTAADATESPARLDGSLAGKFVAWFRAGDPRLVAQLAFGYFPVAERSDLVDSPYGL
jgi:hypothetical protein